MGITTIAFGQGHSLMGEVESERTGEKLPGANIKIKGTSLGTVTDNSGAFFFDNLSEGDYVLVVSYLGFETQEVEVEIADDGTEEVEVELEDNFLEMEGIMVQGVRQGQARALNEQREALNIKNVIDAELISTFPDPNVGESLKRIPGINIQSDQGEARYIQIRGTSPNLSNISINGEKIAAPEGDGRSIALDMIPSDVLASIEVSKAITPDMDGDAIGGTVNLETKSAVTKDRVLNLTLNGGYHNNVSDLSPVGGRASLNYGQRLGEEGKFGYMIGANYNKFSLGSDNNEMAYDEGTLEEMELRDYELTRERFGTTANFDYQFNRKSQLYLNTSFNYFADQEYRRLLGLATDEAVREFKDRLEKQKIFSTSLGGEHGLSNGFRVDYSASYSYSDQHTPEDREIIYAQAYEDAAGEDLEFVGFDRSNVDYPQFSLTPDAPSGAGIYNYGTYEFDEFVDGAELTKDRHVTARLNLSKEIAWSDNFSGIFKVGGLGRFKSKDRALTEDVYGYNGDTTYEGLISDFRDDDYLSGHYANGVGLFPGTDSMRDLFENNSADFERDEQESTEASNAEDYDATEDTYAGYVMTDLQWGNLGTILGVRYEHLRTEYEGNTVEYDQNEELVQPIPTVSDINTFDFILPMVHLKYNVRDNANLRLAWTNTYAKPNYFDLVPYSIISRPDEEIELGNPGLEPARSMNLDLMAEYYFSSIGVISAGVFYKNIQDFIYTANFEYDDAPYSGYEATQPINGDEADLAGFEVALQRQLTFLPGFASGFGIYANYTYTWSDAQLTTEGETARSVSLPGQAADVANVALSYQKYGFSGRISLNYSGEFVEEIRENSADDRYYDKHTQIDISLSQQVTPGIRIFADMVNLTNEPLRYYNGTPTRPEQQEFYSFQVKGGVKLSL
ncbi:TonB-dependent receptor [Fodinibius salsisoli]|uniref:TonB-dependent receptor n=1 Tax=Fodinibius salsisoli TaxID=2820877 RepID=A0ABT3PRF4_9BACT|nr:TonB-dependent receptor [Fodinibius salsisoli]MCW9708434.1 TonB-dependent receptor [Fodinibius salsisoli]